MESEADRLAMLTALGGGTVGTSQGSFVGLYEADFVQVGDLPVDSSASRITARTSDVAGLALADGSEVTYDGTTYTVRSVQNDGTGMTVLILEAP